jgi:hypothetical protein
MYFWPNPASWIGGGEFEHWRYDDAESGRAMPVTKRGQDAEANRKEVSRVGEEESRENRFSETPEGARR